MSGGFFRGTSADQDTRFSNKQAKLLKSQKFAPELEHLVDMSKVSMDVMRPWIANRATELLGFEDEVLINFIYGLLEGKVNGKEIQISLTGFMEKNTVKFMKELWTLLISAQNNASGVPQQFLDAKQEEARKKKEEADRFANEIQKKKEKERIDQQEMLKMEGGAGKKANNAALEPNTKHMSPRDSNDRYEDERGAEKRNGVKARNKVSRSPNSENSSLSPRERHRSQSISKSPKALRRSISSESDRSPPRRPITTVRRHSPEGSISPRRRSPYSRQRSRSNSQQRSPSPYRRRVRSPYWRRPSPVRRRRSPSPVRRHRSPSPVRRRRSPSPVRRRRSPSPVRHHRSPSPVRRRRSPSPVRRRRSPSPVRRRRSPSPVRRPRSPSPVRHRRSPSPVRRRRSRSPLRRRRSPSPLRRCRSRSPVRRRSPSPVRRSYRRSPLNTRDRYVSPLQHRSPVRSRGSPTPLHRSPSLHDRSSSPIQHDSPSPIRRTSKLRRSPSQSPQERTSVYRSLEKTSPVPHRSSSHGSLQRELKNGNDSRKRATDFLPSPERSCILSESQPGVRNSSEERRSLSSPDESPVRRPREQMTRNVSSSPPRKLREQLRRGSPDTSEDKPIVSPAKVRNKEEYSKNRLGNKDFRNKEQEMKSGKSSGRGVPESPDQQHSPTIYKDSLHGEMQNPNDGRKSDEKNRSHSKNSKDSDRHRKLGSVHSSVEKVDPSNRSGTVDSGSEESGKRRGGDKGKRKNKRSERQEVTSEDDYSNDSEIDERKDTKRRRKEEKRSRKEKKRRRREERRRRKEERRAEKLKGKNYSGASASDGEHVGRRELHSSDNEETEAVQKKLEIELRKKALESLKAKKGISH
ncbi:serine/arginine repetitive matrix protein 1 isoform X2 [Pyrus x bretschneideri]|uniref:serine/arginine repetitive matrix protein 1 isoform X2 n=1 Tax=Pyrus x bretschneideri TaxID=225117 RepID=UPI00202F8142|nr:serine/arginine repetitive matrix protein 1 isoform X2 [Pyrus x bretschneideri]